MAFRATRNAIPFTIVLLCASLTAYLSLRETIAMPWFWHMEEAPYGQEALRFLSGDFRQRFFDIPGTPFMLAAAGIFKAALLFAPGTPDPFDHLDLLFVILRALSAAAFIASGWLLFSTARTMVSVWPAALAALAIVVHPILLGCLYHTRIEPTALFLVSGAVLCWATAIRSGSPNAYRAAAFLAGLAMAARFPLALAAMPMFIVYAMFRPTVYARLHGPERIVFPVLLCVGLIGAAASALYLGGVIPGGWLTDTLLLTASGASSWPHALRMIGGLWIGIGAAAFVALALFVWARSMALRYLRSSLVVLICWFFLGFALEIPFVLVRSNYFLSAIEAFLTHRATSMDLLYVVQLYTVGHTLSAFTDLLPLHYGGVIFTPPLIALFIAAFFNRSVDRWLLATIMLGCLIGVLAQTGKQQVPRHIVGWLPWFSLMLAIGAETILARARHPIARAAAVAFCIAAVAHLAAVGWHATAGPIRHDVERMAAVQGVQEWVAKNTAPDAVVMYACCSSLGEDAHLLALSSTGLHPSKPLLRPGTQAWGWDYSTLKRQREGFVIFGTIELKGSYGFWRQFKPTEAVDPTSDTGFTHLASIPIRRISTLEIYSFSLGDDPPKLAAGGIAVIDASYGENCAARLAGNATPLLRRTCDKRSRCNFGVEVGLFGSDPAPGCTKAFSVRWRCEQGDERHLALPAEAHGQTAALRCD